MLSTGEIVLWVEVFENSLRGWIRENYHWVRLFAWRKQMIEESMLDNHISSWVK